MQIQTRRWKRRSELMAEAAEYRQSIRTRAPIPARKEGNRIGPPRRIRPIPSLLTRMKDADRRRAVHVYV